MAQFGIEGRSINPSVEVDESDEPPPLPYDVGMRLNHADSQPIRAARLMFCAQSNVVY